VIIVDVHIKIYVYIHVQIHRLHNTWNPTIYLMHEAILL